MTAPVPPPLEGEVLGPGDRVPVILALNPLRLDHERLSLPAGWSVAEILRFALVDRPRSPLTRRHAVYVNGEAVPAEWWPRMRVKAGATVLVRAVAGEGGGNLLRTILSLAVAVAGMAFAGPLAGALGLSALGAFGTALAGAAITVAGTLLVNALFPIRPPQLASDSTSATYSIGGARNEASPFGVVSAILGRHRLSPKYGAKPYTEFIGEDQFVRCLFVWGYGPLAISDLKIGETPISEYEDVEIETREGYSGDAPLTLFPGAVFQEDLSIELKAADGWQQRTSAPDVDELSVDLVAPQGMYNLNDDGSRSNIAIVLQAQYRAVGGTSWLTLGSVDLTSSSKQPIRRTVRKAVSPRGQWEVRVQRVTPDRNSDRKIDAWMWTALRGTRNTAPIAFPQPLAVTAIRIKASGQLNGGLDNFNGIVESKGKKWNGSAWVADQKSRNPADLFRLVLQHPANARPRSDSQLDLATLQAWHAECAAKGYTFDQVRDTQASVWDTLADIAAAGRATPLFRDGKWSVAWDDPAAPVVQHFTPRNSWGFRGRRSYRRQPHGWRVRFVNEEKNWLQDERIVYADGYNAGNATLFEAIEFPGVTSPALIWKHGRVQAAQAKLRPETYRLTVDFEHLVCTRPDRVRVTHDVPMWGLTSGRVKGIAGQTVTLDEPVLMEEGKAYAVRFRLADGSSLYRTVLLEPGERRVLSLVGTGDLPEAGDLAMFGEAGTETVVLRIKAILPGDEMTAELELVDDAPAIATADQGAIPAFESRITVPADPLTLAPLNLRAEERIGLGETGAEVSALLTWQVLVSGTVDHFEVGYRDDAGDRIWRDAGTAPAAQRAFEVVDLAGGTWSFRVRSIFSDGTPSGWATLTAATIVGLSRVPADVEDFRIAVLADLATLSWAPVTTPGLDHYTIRYSPSLAGVTWGSATVLRERVDQTSIQVPAMVGTYLIKGVSVAGVESANPAAIVSAVAGLAALNVVETFQAEPAWDGTLTDVEVADDALRLSQVGTIFDWPSIFAITPGYWTTQFPQAVGVFESAEIIDLGEVFTSRVTVQVEALGDNIANGIGNWGPLGGVGLIGGDNADQWAVRVFARHTLDDPEDPEAEWSEYEEIIISDVTARAFGPFRIQLYSLAPGVTPVVTSAKVFIDMPDRVVAGDDLLSNSGAVLHVAFDPPFRALEGLAIAAQDMATGDYSVISGKDETGFDIRFYAAGGSGVARTFDYVAKGYGRQVSA